MFSVFLIAKREERRETRLVHKTYKLTVKEPLLDLTSGFADGDRHHILHLVTVRGADIDLLDFYYCYLGRFAKEFRFVVS